MARSRPCAARPHHCSPAASAPIEPLEGRTLLSAALAHPNPSAAWHAAARTTAAVAKSAIIVLPTPIAQSGVTLHELAGVPFTAVVGSFGTAAPASTLHATIVWGDGSTSSDGKIVPAAATAGAATAIPRYDVAGSHTYATAGTFQINTVVTQSGPPGSLAPTRLIAVIHGTAIVTPAKTNVKLDGTITGTYSLAPTAAFLGALYLFNGTGAAGDMGPVQATGRVQLPPPIFATPVASAPNRFATGTLTLTSMGASPLPGGSVTLKLTSPTPVASSGPFPKVLNYVVTGGTGAFAGATGSGTIDVVLDPTGQKFTFTIHSA